MNLRSDYHEDPCKPTTQWVLSLRVLGSASLVPEKTASALGR
jgi:hypothetical protein